MVSNIFYFHPYLGKWSNLTCAYFWNGLKFTTNNSEFCFNLFLACPRKQNRQAPGISTCGIPTTMTNQWVEKYTVTTIVKNLRVLIIIQSLGKNHYFKNVVEARNLNGGVFLCGTSRPFFLGITGPPPDAEPSSIRIHPKCGARQTSGQNWNFGKAWIFVAPHIQWIFQVPVKGGR